MYTAVCARATSQVFDHLREPSIALHVPDEIGTADSNSRRRLYPSQAPAKTGQVISPTFYTRNCLFGKPYINVLEPGENQILEQFTPCVGIRHP